MMRLIMAHLLSFLYILTIAIIPAATHASAIAEHQIILSSGEKLLGEIVHQYEARWFWETTGPKYYALFDSEKGSFSFIAESEISKVEKTGEEIAKSYVEFCQDRKLNFQRFPLDSAILISTRNDGHHLSENMYGDFAWDMQVKRKGKTHQGNGKKNENYFVWGEAVYAPVSGEIIDLARDKQDQPADPSLSRTLDPNDQGNFLLIRINGDFYVVLLHFQKDSIPDFKVGQKINAGDFIGRVGNSGISYVPHLHMTTYYYSKKLQRMISVPNEFSVPPKKPQTGQTVQNL